MTVPFGFTFLLDRLDCIFNVFSHNNDYCHQYGNEPPKVDKMSILDFFCLWPFAVRLEEETFVNPPLGKEWGFYLLKRSKEIYQ